jgi:hypothetical protein
MKPAQTILVFNHNRVFCADMLHLRAENTVGARSAQNCGRSIKKGGRSRPFFA